MLQVDDNIPKGKIMIHASFYKQWQGFFSNAVPRSNLFSGSVLMLRATVTYQSVTVFDSQAESFTF